MYLPFSIIPTSKVRDRAFFSLFFSKPYMFLFVPVKKGNFSISSSSCLLWAGGRVVGKNGGEQFSFLWGMFRLFFYMFVGLLADKRVELTASQVIHIPWEHFPIIASQTDSFQVSVLLSAIHYNNTWRTAIDLGTEVYAENSGVQKNDHLWVWRPPWLFYSVCIWSRWSCSVYSTLAMCWCGYKVPLFGFLFTAPQFLSFIRR